jgi:hypothetical protein
MTSRPDMDVEVVPGAEPTDHAIEAWSRLLLHLIDVEDQAAERQEGAA